MKVIMISLDKTLLGADYSGDVLERHKEYAKHVDSLDIIVFSKKGFSKRQINDKLTIYPTNSISKIFYVWNAYRIGRGVFGGNTKSLLVVTQTPFLTALAGWILKVRFGVKLLIHFHGDFWQNKYWLQDKWWLNWILLWLSKFLVKKADGIRVVSLGIKKKLITGGIEVDKIRVISTPVDLEKFENYDKDEVYRLKNTLSSDWKVIINVGRKDASKDYKTLWKAVNIVHDKYRKLAFWQIGANINLNDKIILSTGKIKQQLLVNYYHASDIYVSSSRHESFGKVLIEAMACGLPVVATETTGSKEIIEDGVNGFLVSIGDSEALARKVIYLLNNPDIAQKMGEAGQIMVRKRFNREIIIDKIINFWEDICVY